MAPPLAALAPRLLSSDPAQLQEALAALRALVLVGSYWTLGQDRGWVCALTEDRVRLMLPEGHLWIPLSEFLVTALPS